MQTFNTFFILENSQHCRKILIPQIFISFFSLFIKVFPSEKGWPFPKFYGACGRAIVIEDAGLPLDIFLSYPWIERAKLALGVIKIAKQLTNNLDHWGLYLTGVELDNFVVSNGTVKLEDASHILVVDLLESNVKGKVNHVLVLIIHQIFFARAIGLNTSRDAAKTGEYQMIFPK